MIGKLLCMVGRHRPRPVGRYTMSGDQLRGTLACARPGCGWLRVEPVDWERWKNWNRGAR
jgi:hypothetical protein